MLICQRSDLLWGSRAWTSFLSCGSKGCWWLHIDFFGPVTMPASFMVTTSTRPQNHCIQPCRHGRLKPGGWTSLGPIKPPSLPYAVLPLAAGLPSLLHSPPLYLALIFLRSSCFLPSLTALERNKQHWGTYHLALSLCSLLAVWELHSSPISLDNPTFSFITVMWFHVSDDSAGGKRQGFDRSAEEGSGLELVWSLSKGFWRFEDGDGDWAGAEVAWVW